VAYSSIWTRGWCVLFGRTFWTVEVPHAERTLLMKRTKQTSNRVWQSGSGQLDPPIHWNRFWYF